MCAADLGVCLAEAVRQKEHDEVDERRAAREDEEPGRNEEDVAPLLKDVRPPGLRRDRPPRPPGSRLGRWSVVDPDHDAEHRDQLDDGDTEKGDSDVAGNVRDCDEGKADDVAEDLHQADHRAREPDLLIGNEVRDVPLEGAARHIRADREQGDKCRQGDHGVRLRNREEDDDVEQ